MKSTDDEQAGRFLAEMDATGWEPIYDIFGGVLRFRRRTTGKIVEAAAARNYWWMSGKTPEAMA